MTRTAVKTQLVFSCECGTRIVSKYRVSLEKRVVAHAQARHQGGYQPGWSDSWCHLCKKNVSPVSLGGHIMVDHGERERRITEEDAP